MNDQPSPTTRPNLLDRVFLWAAAMEEDIISECPPHDWNTARGLGALLLINFVWETDVFYQIGAHLFGTPGTFEPLILLHSAGIGLFVMLIDNACVLRSHWYRAGLAQLRQAGIALETALAPRIHAGMFFMIRVVLASSMAQLVGTGSALLIYADDIDARLHHRYLQDDASLIADATAQVDERIEAAKSKVAAQKARVDDLSANVSSLRGKQIDPLAADPRMAQAQKELSQAVVRKDEAAAAVVQAEKFAADELAGVAGAGHSGVSGAGPRRKAANEQLANARARAAESDRAVAAARSRAEEIGKQLASSADGLKQQSRDALPDYEQALNAEEGKASSLKGELDQLIAQREETIRKAVESAPGFVPQEHGLLTQLATLEAIMQENGRIKIIVALLDLTATGFELAAMLAATGSAPTLYASLLVQRGFMTDTRIADEIGEALDLSAEQRERRAAARGTGPSASRDKRAPAEPIIQGNDASSAQPKRPRGRPRKNPLNEPAISTTE